MDNFQKRNVSCFQKGSCHRLSYAGIEQKVNQLPRRV